MSARVLTEEEVEKQFPEAYANLLDSEETGNAMGAEFLKMKDMVFWTDMNGRLNYAAKDQHSGYGHRVWDRVDEVWEQVI